MKKTVLIAALSVLPLCLAAQEKVERLDSIVVSASRAGKNTPVSYENVGKAALEASSPMNSLPMALNLLPSVVTYNEGGTGLGNSAMTIRGTKGSQINVTLNGITLNDAESQEVFWVNIPSLQSLISSVQVQRGLGTSAAGAGAFGASINMNTAFVTPDPWVTAEFGGGSFNTFVTTLAGSTGRSRKGWYGTAAYSHASTDGYIRNAFVQSNSGLVTLGWLGRHNSVRLTYLMGQQRSGITWDGIDLEQFSVDPTYNGAGEYYDEYGNIYYYPNQTDNYAQHHLQLNYTLSLGNLSWTNTLNYTRGDGYDEYYKRNKKLRNYGFDPQFFTGRSDLVYQKKLDNNLWVFQSTLRYQTGNLNVSAGANLSRHDGRHWGEVLWVKIPLTSSYLPNLGDLDWYRNYGRKWDGSVYVRAEYQPLKWLTGYADLQFRHIRYTFTGKDDDWLEYGANPADILGYHQVWNFFNPRAGVTASFGRHRIFASAAIGHREPGRSDIKENIKGEGSPIRPEAMLDLELGYRYSSEHLEASVNLYAMEYKDMLLETGKLSSSGYALKENVSRAWRRGVELTAAWQAAHWFKVDGNATFSMNQIADYTSYVSKDDYSGTVAVPYGRTTMLLSPSVIGMLRLSFEPFRNTLLSLDGKYVGKQYIDNSMREGMAIPAYYLVNLGATHTFALWGGDIKISAYVNNLLNRSYYASGWRWEAIDAGTGELYYGVGVYPQAPRNFCIKCTLTF